MLFARFFKGFNAADDVAFYVFVFYQVHGEFNGLLNADIFCLLHGIFFSACKGINNRESFYI